MIRKGGYDKGLIEATRIYLRNMIRRAKDPDFLTMPIKAVIGDSVSKGWVSLWEAYGTFTKSTASACRGFTRTSRCR